MRRHVAIWVDHHEARVFEVHPHPLDQLTPRGEQRVPRLGPGPCFHRAVVRALGGTERVLLLGPRVPKGRLLRYLLDHHRTIVADVVGTKTVTHPTDAQLLAYARWHFRSRPRRLTWA